MELDLLQKINHPNIVKFYGFFFKSHHLYIILEYCSGGSVSKILKIIKKNEDIIRQYTFQILCGLEYLHAHNIIHRDIKCANILIGKNGTCKLTDFGGAKMIKEEISIMTSMQGNNNILLALEALPDDKQITFYGWQFCFIVASCILGFIFISCTIDFFDLSVAISSNDLLLITTSAATFI